MRRRWGRTKRLLSAKWWGGIAALAAILALAVPAVSGDQDGSETVAAVPECDIYLDADCPIPSTAGERLGAVKLIADSSWGSWFYAGPPSELPTPPDYPVHEAVYHCDDWLGWLTSTPDIYSMNPGGDLLLQAGTDSVVTITRVQAQSFTRERIPDEYTEVGCNYGAGGEAGIVITPDTRTPAQATVVDYGEEDPRPFAMPPGVVTVGDVEGEAAQITVKSGEYLYEGMIKVAATINGQSQQFSIGSPEKPYRWVGGDTSLVSSPDIKDRWDWNPLTGEWVQGLDVHGLAGDDE